MSELERLAEALNAYGLSAMVSNDGKALSLRLPVSPFSVEWDGTEECPALAGNNIPDGSLTWIGSDLQWEGGGTFA